MTATSTTPDAMEAKTTMERVLSGATILDVAEQIGSDGVSTTANGEIAATRFSIGTHRSEIGPSSRCELVLSLKSSGSLVTEVDGQNIKSRVNPGTLTFVPAHLQHGFDFTGQTTNTVLGIEMSLLHRVRDIEPDLPPVSMLEPRFAWTRPELQRLIEEQHRILAAGEAGWRVLAESLSLRIGYELLAAFGQTPRKSGEPAALTGAELAQLIDFIEAEMEQNFDLTALATVLGRDQFGFSRAFRAATGDSPHQYVIQRRLMRAKQLLADTTDALADIAYSTGFASQSHMTATFSKHVGMPPGAYRKEART